MIKDCPRCFFEIEREGPSCECCGHTFISVVASDAGDWVDFKETDVGFESKILTAIEPVAPRRAAFANGALSVVDVTQADIDQITEAIRDVVPFSPFNVRRVGDDEFVIDFDHP